MRSRDWRCFGLCWTPTGLTLVCNQAEKPLLPFVGGGTSFVYIVCFFAHSIYLAAEYCVSSSSSTFDFRGFYLGYAAPRNPIRYRERDHLWSVGHLQTFAPRSRPILQRRLSSGEAGSNRFIDFRLSVMLHSPGQGIVFLRFTEVAVSSR